MRRAQPSSVALRLLVPALAVVLAGCATSEPETPEPVAERVENETLGLAIEELPDTFTVALNQGEALILQADGKPGRVETTVGPPVGAVNLIEELKAHQAAIEARPDGAYNGQTELVAQLGRVYLSRGRFTGDDGVAQEEYKAIGLHPAGDRAFYLTYVYPVGDDTAERGQALVELVGELVPAESAATAGGP